MTGKTFFNTIANGKADFLQQFLDILRETNAAYCIIGGLAVNAYAEPVVSLDLDIVVVATAVEEICRMAVQIGFSVERSEHSINLTSTKSDLRIQLQTDARYQEFIARSITKEVLGYTMSVAALEDVLRGKTWAYTDETRRKSKRQKDLADILRLVETHPYLKDSLSPEIATKLE